MDHEPKTPRNSRSGRLDGPSHLERSGCGPVTKLDWNAPKIGVSRANRD
jgi:hypothetical protein